MRFAKRGGIWVPQSNKRARLGNTEYWAENGIICATHLGTGQFTQISVKQLKYACRKVQEALGTSSSEGVERDAKERREMQRFLEDVNDIIRDGFEQGTPDFPDMLEQKVSALPKLFT